MHHIRQQHLHVELNGSESDGLALQSRLPELCQDWLMPALERVLDKYAPPEGNLYIERLEIDAGAMSLERLEHDLAESVVQALEKALQEQIPSETETTAAHRSDKVQHKTTQVSILEAFVFFLETGQLPWTFQLPEGQILEQVILDTWQETGQSGGIQGADNALRQVLTSESARKRLTRQFTPKLLRPLLTQMAPAGATAMDTMLQVLRSGTPPAESRKIELLLWENTFAWAVAGNALIAEEMIDEILPLALAEHGAVPEVSAHHRPLAPESTSIPPVESKGREEEQGETAPPATESPPRSEPASPPAKGASAEKKLAAPLEGLGKTAQPSAPKLLAQQERPAAKEKRAEEPYFSGNTSTIQNKEILAQERPQETALPPFSSPSSEQPSSQQEPVAQQEKITREQAPASVLFMSCSAKTGRPLLRNSRERLVHRDLLKILNTRLQRKG